MGGENENPGSQWPRIALAVVSLAIVVAGIIWAIAIVGTPETARNKRADEARVDDLRSLHWAIDRFYVDKGEIPKRLEELDIDPRHLQDSETGESYGYTVVDSTSYKLSANFKSDSIGNRQYYGTDWGHPAGVHHFSFTAPKD